MAQIVMGGEGESRAVMPTKWHSATWLSSRLVPVSCLLCVGDLGVTQLCHPCTYPGF